MTKIGQNIESANPVLTLEQKLAIQKQNKACQSWLNAYVKDKNRKALKERQRLEKEAAKAEKLAAKQKHQKSVAPVADIQLESKAGKEKSEVWKCPVEVLRMLFDANRMAVLPIYLTATREKEFSGTVLKKNIPDLANRLKRNPNSIMRQLAQLEGLGLCKRFKNVWMFTGGKMVTAFSGRTRVKLVRVEKLDRSALTTLAYATFISEQGRRLISKAKKDNPSLSQGRVKVEIASSYTGRWLGRSQQTVSARRKKAKEAGLIDYKRQFKFMHKGGKSVKDAFCNARSNGETAKGEFLTSKGANYLWLSEQTAHFTSLLYFTTYSVYSNTKLRDIARQRHGAK